MRVENSRFRLFSHSNERTNTLSNSEINESYMCIFRVRAPKKKKILCTTYSQLAYREQGTRPVRWVRSVYPRRRISSSSTSSSSSIRPSCYADFRCERRWWGDDGVTPFDSNSLSSGLVPVKWHGRLQAGHAAPPARATVAVACVARPSQHVPIGTGAARTARIAPDADRTASAAVVATTVSSSPYLLVLRLPAANRENEQAESNKLSSPSS